MVGIGGALVMVPTAGAAYALKQLQANSTALLPNVATCASGACVFAANGHVDPVAGVLVAAAATATAGPGARMAHRLTERTQKYMFAWALLVMGPIIAVKPYLTSRSSTGTGGEGGGDTPPHTTKTAATGDTTTTSTAATGDTTTTSTAAATTTLPPPVVKGRRVGAAGATTTGDASGTRVAAAAAAATTAAGGAKKGGEQEDDDKEMGWARRVAAARGAAAAAAGVQLIELVEVPTPARGAYYLALGAAVGAASGVLGIGAGTMMSVGLALAGRGSSSSPLPITTHSLLFDV